jgi:hypothetical protein
VARQDIPEHMDTCWAVPSTPVEKWDALERKWDTGRPFITYHTSDFPRDKVQSGTRCVGT